MSTATHPIPLDELPSHLRALAKDMALVGAAIRYYGGFGPFAEYGQLLLSQSAPLCRDLAVSMEKMRGSRA